jgi:hypothetical protein
MQWEHSLQWHCTAESHDPMTFLDPRHFEDHLVSDHPDSFTRLQASILADQRARPAEPLFTTCPLCNCVPADIAKFNSQQVNISKLLEKHIKEHLEYFALKSLPWRDDVKTETSAATNVGLLGKDKAETERSDSEKSKETINSEAGRKELIRNIQLDFDSDVSDPQDLENRGANEFDEDLEAYSELPSFPPKDEYDTSTNLPYEVAYLYDEAYLNNPTWEEDGLASSQGTWKLLQKEKPPFWRRIAPFVGHSNDPVLASFIKSENETHFAELKDGQGLQAGLKHDLLHFHERE